MADEAPTGGGRCPMEDNGAVEDLLHEHPGHEGDLDEE